MHPFENDCGSRSEWCRATRRWLKSLRPSITAPETARRLFIAPLVVTHLTTIDRCRPWFCDGLAAIVAGYEPTRNWATAPGADRRAMLTAAMRLRGWRPDDQEYFFAVGAPKHGHAVFVTGTADVPARVAAVCEAMVLGYLPAPFDFSTWSE